MKMKEACFKLKGSRNRERDKGSPCCKNQSRAKEIWRGGCKKAHL